MKSNYFNISKLHRTPVNSMTSSHVHSFWELFYLIDGKCGVMIKDLIYEIEPGTLFLIPHDVSHRTFYDLPDSLRIDVEFGDDFIDEIRDQFSDVFFDQRYCCRFFTLEPPLLHRTEDNLEMLIQELNRNDALSSAFIKVHLQEVLLNMMRYGRDITATLNTKEAFLQSDNPIIQESMRYIENHFKENLTLTVLANQVHLNASYFSKLFKDETGMTFKDFLNSIRISHAERLILETSLSISEIAAQCGYESGNYFGDAFKKANGVSPVKFRAQGGYI